jgi:hypothetical protein
MNRDPKSIPPTRLRVSQKGDNHPVEKLVFGGQQHPIAGSNDGENQRHRNNHGNATQGGLSFFLLVFHRVAPRVTSFLRVESAKSRGKP